MPTARSRSPLSVRMAAVTVRAATRAISPSRRRRERHYARSRLGIVSTTCRCGTGARSVVSRHGVQRARRLAWQLGQQSRHLQEKADRYFSRTVVAADTRAPVLEHAAGEELVGDLRHDLRHDRAPRAVLAGEALVVNRLQPMQMV